MDMPVNGCDAYVDKLRKECNELVIERHTTGVVSDELLLHTTGMK